MRYVSTRFASGASIAWRNCVRLSPATGYEPSYACAMTVVQDREGELALYRGPGYPTRRRNGDSAPCRVSGISPVETLLREREQFEEWRSWRPDLHGRSLFC